MGRPAKKADLISTGNDNFEKLKSLIESMTEKELSTPFSFESDENKKEAHWNRDKNLRDVLIHLYEWHRLILNWVAANMNNIEKPFLPYPYNWKSYGDMNIAFWEKHQKTSLNEAVQMLTKSHMDIMELAETFSDQELFTKHIYKWVGGSTLGSYFVSGTASYYDWAIKKLKAHIKNCKV